MHPQHWTDDIDYAGKRVVVIGSGATAVTLVPAMAETRRARDDAAALAELRRLAAGRGPDRQLAAPAAAGAGSRTRSCAGRTSLLTMLSFQLSRRRPSLVKALLRKGLEKQLPPGYDIDTHFTPRYNPGTSACAWCPTATCSRRSATAARRWSPTRSTRSPRRASGWRSGAELEADLIVTATGLNMLDVGGMRARRRRPRGRAVRDDELQGHDARATCRTWRWRSATRTPRGRSSAISPASTSAGCSTTWTSTATSSARRRTRPLGAEEPFIDFSSGYVLRSIDKFPEQGSKAPWRLYQNYALDILSLRFGAVEDRRCILTHAPAPVAAVPALVA